MTTDDARSKILLSTYQVERAVNASNSQRNLTIASAIVVYIGVVASVLISTGCSGNGCRDVPPVVLEGLPLPALALSAFLLLAFAETVSHGLYVETLEAELSIRCGKVRVPGFQRYSHHFWDPVQATKALRALNWLWPIAGALTLASFLTGLMFLAYQSTSGSKGAFIVAATAYGVAVLFLLVGACGIFAEFRERRPNQDCGVDQP
jgi:hypothetical protein